MKCELHTVKHQRLQGCHAILGKLGGQPDSISLIQKYIYVLEVIMTIMLMTGLVRLSPGFRLKDCTWLSLSQRLPSKPHSGTSGGGPVLSQDFIWTKSPLLQFSKCHLWPFYLDNLCNFIIKSDTWVQWLSIGANSTTFAFWEVDHLLGQWTGRLVSKEEVTPWYTETT